MMETVILTIEEYEELVDARDHAVAMRGVAAGTIPVLSREEAEAYLAAGTPLAFWRAHRGSRLDGLAVRAGVELGDVAAIEDGGGPGMLWFTANLPRCSVCGLRICSPNRWRWGSLPVFG